MKKAIVLHERDNVATLIDDVSKNTDVTLTGERDETLKIATDIPYGHKCALHPIRKGEKILKYGQVIGRATSDIALGEHVHVHNVEALRARGDQQEGDTR